MTVVVVVVLVLVVVVVVVEKSVVTVFVVEKLLLLLWMLSHNIDVLRLGASSVLGPPELVLSCGMSLSSSQLNTPPYFTSTTLC